MAFKLTPPLLRRMAFQFADVLTEIEAARLLTYNAARLKVSPSSAFSASLLMQYVLDHFRSKASPLCVKPLWPSTMLRMSRRGLQAWLSSGQVASVSPGKLDLKSIGETPSKSRTVATSVSWVLTAPSVGSVLSTKEPQTSNSRLLPSSSRRTTYKAHTMRSARMARRRLLHAVWGYGVYAQIK